MSGGKIPTWNHLEVSLDSNVLLIRLNRPRVKNAFNFDTYRQLTNCLQWAGSNQDVRVAVLTGNGDFYSSGNDLSVFTSGDATTDAGERQNSVRSMVDSFIEFPKPLVAALNGPAIGISFTTLGLVDFVFVTPKCYVFAPFAVSAQAPEGCSSVMFPRIFGIRTANDILYRNLKIDATKLVEMKFANQMFSENELIPKVMEIAKEMASFSTTTMLQTKRVLRPPRFVKYLKKVNEEEMEGVQRALSSPEFFESMSKYMAKSLGSQKSKL